MTIRDLHLFFSMAKPCQAGVTVDWAAVRVFSSLKGVRCVHWSNLIHFEWLFNLVDSISLDFSWIYINKYTNRFEPMASDENCFWSTGISCTGQKSSKNEFLLNISRQTRENTKLSRLPDIRFLHGLCKPPSPASFVIFCFRQGISFTTALFLSFDLFLFVHVGWWYV